MDQNSYEGKLTQLVEIFQGDEDYAKIVLDKWLQKHRADFEAQIMAEVSRRLEGLNSIVPVTLKVLIDSQGVRLPGGAVPAAEKTLPKKEKRASTGKKSPLVRALIVQVQEYEKRLATAITLLGEEAGRRYMEQRLRELRSDIEQRLYQEVKGRLAGLSLPLPLTFYVDIGPQGVKVRSGRRSR